MDVPSKTGCETEARRLEHVAFHDLAVEILDRQHGLVFRAHGRSMRPFIGDGDTVQVESVDAGRLRVGDIVLFRTAGGVLLAHRIVRRGEPAGAPVWVTRGDARLAADAPFTSDQLLGRVSRRIRRGRSVPLDRGWRRWAGLIWMRAIRLRSFLRRLTVWRG